MLWHFRNYCSSLDLTISDLYCWGSNFPKWKKGSKPLCHTQRLCCWLWKDQRGCRSASFILCAHFIAFANRACSNTVTPSTLSCSSSQSSVLTQFLCPVCPPPCGGTTREDCCPLCGDTSVAAQPLCVLPGNYKCYYCQWSGGTPLFTGFFFAMKLKYCTALAMEAWIALTHHPLSWLSVKQALFLPFMQTPLTSGFLFLHCGGLFDKFFPPLLTSAIFTPVRSKFSPDCVYAGGREEWAPSHTAEYVGGNSPPFNVAGASEVPYCSFPCSPADLQSL